ncbi:hypothetical protein BCR32DRAFT_292402 [Anaeromyces robustus]|uniref:Alpha/beta-hydrolase n=1 Tax=Anaeromyces robustus TaxID=1754192 RepID=A0A1Y1XAJ7_9FUNG|nr:hypothetical protein BCR32DRAFT_292402 [Anaeromyces robustus]|eukprot:ORX82760.1 hypothetical protein BCR32DRAFT_292402 [Anaeromyces robustus]
MPKTLTINNRKITIYYNEENFDENKKYPIVIYNSFNGNANGLWLECLKQKCSEFILIVLEVLKWNEEMTPWKSDPIFKNVEGYGGKADDYINVIINDIIPEVEKLFKPEYYALAGYSLAGLFTIYSMFKTNIFTRFFSGSGSFWYPEFLNFVENNKIIANVDKVYMSLGNKEKKTSNKVLKTIETDTLKMKDYLNNLNINVKFEFYNGNHFNDVDLRVATGIKWILE